MAGSSNFNNAKMSMTQAEINEMIRKKAYELYEKRGHKPGSELTDWLEAERIIKQRTFEMK